MGGDVNTVHLVTARGVEVVAAAVEGRGRARAGWRGSRRTLRRRTRHERDRDPRCMRLPHGDGLPLPAYQSALAAGLDLIAAVPADAPVVIAPGERALIPTGIAIALPPGFEGTGAAALGTGAATRRHRAQCARHDRCRLSRRNTGHSCKSWPRIHSQSNGRAHCTTGHRSYNASRRFAKLQVWMKPHAEFGVLVLRGQRRGKRKQEPLDPVGSSNILPSPVRPLVLDVKVAVPLMLLLPRKGILAIAAVIESP